MVETFQHASTGITNLAQQKCQNLLYLNNNKNPSWQSLSIRVPMGDACRVDTLPLFRYVDSAADVKTHSPPQVTPRLGLGKGKAPVMPTPERGIGGRAIRRQETRRPVQQRPQISAQLCRPRLLASPSSEHVHASISSGRCCHHATGAAVQRRPRMSWLSGRAAPTREGEGELRWRGAAPATSCGGSRRHPRGCAGTCRRARAPAASCSVSCRHHCISKARVSCAGASRRGRVPAATCGCSHGRGQGELRWRAQVWASNGGDLWLLTRACSS